jgi:hypothetical protein
MEQPRSRFDLHWPVIVAVVAMGMVEMAVDEIIDVVAVRDGRVSAAGAMHMAGLVSATVVPRGASIGVRRRHFDHMLFDLLAVRMMKMPVVQVVHMPLMLDGRVSAIRAVLMNVAIVSFVSGHNRSPDPRKEIRKGAAPDKIVTVFRFVANKAQGAVRETQSSLDQIAALN